jgi:hypothetical protein
MENQFSQDNNDYKRMYLELLKKNKELETRLLYNQYDPNIGRIVEGVITKLLKNKKNGDFGFIKFENIEYYFDASDIGESLTFTNLYLDKKYRFRLKESRDRRPGRNSLQAHILQSVQEEDFAFDFVKRSLDVNKEKTDIGDVRVNDLVSFDYKGDFQFGLIKKITLTSKRVVFLDYRLRFGQHHFKKTREESLVGRKYTIYN